MMLHSLTGTTAAPNDPVSSGALPKKTDDLTRNPDAAADNGMQESFADVFGTGKRGTRGAAAQASDSQTGNPPASGTIADNDGSDGAPDPALEPENANETASYETARTDGQTHDTQSRKLHDETARQDRAVAPIVTTTDVAHSDAKPGTAATSLANVQAGNETYTAVERSDPSIVVQGTLANSILVPAQTTSAPDGPVTSQTGTTPWPAHTAPPDAGLAPKHGANAGASPSVEAMAAPLTHAVQALTGTAPASASATRQMAVPNALPDASQNGAAVAPGAAGSQGTDLPRNLSEAAATNTVTRGPAEGQIGLTPPRVVTAPVASGRLPQSAAFPAMSDDTKAKDLAQPRVGAPVAQITMAANPVQKTTAPGTGEVGLSHLAHPIATAPDTKPNARRSPDISPVRITPTHSVTSSPPASFPPFEAPLAAHPSGLPGQTRDGGPNSQPETISFSAVPGAAQTGVETATLARSGQSPLFQHPDLPRHVMQQLAGAMRSATERAADLVLNPAELGRVRISLSTADTGVVVSIMAERPETLDLMRRHADQLAQDFRDIGYGSAEFSFGQDGAGTPRSSPNDTGPGTEATSDGPASMEPRPQASRATPSISLDRVDLRL